MLFVSVVVGVLCRLCFLLCFIFGCPFLVNTALAAQQRGLELESALTVFLIIVLISLLNLKSGYLGSI